MAVHGTAVPFNLTGKLQSTARWIWHNPDLLIRTQSVSRYRIIRPWMGSSRSSQRSGWNLQPHRQARRIKLSHEHPVYSPILPQISPVSTCIAVLTQLRSSSPTPQAVTLGPGIRTSSWLMSMSPPYQIAFQLPITGVVPGLWNVRSKIRRKPTTKSNGIRIGGPVYWQFDLQSSWPGMVLRWLEPDCSYLLSIDLWWKRSHQGRALWKWSKEWYLNITWRWIHRVIYIPLYPAKSFIEWESQNSVSIGVG